MEAKKKRKKRKEEEETRKKQIKMIKKALHVSKIKERRMKEIHKKIEQKSMNRQGQAECYLLERSTAAVHPDELVLLADVPHAGILKRRGGIHIDAHPCETFPGILCCLYGRDLCYLLEFSSTSLSTRPGDRPPRRSVQECPQGSLRARSSIIRANSVFTYISAN